MTERLRALADAVGDALTLGLIVLGLLAITAVLRLRLFRRRSQ